MFNKNKTWADFEAEAAVKILALEKEIGDFKEMYAIAGMLPQTCGHILFGKGTATFVVETPEEVQHLLGRFSLQGFVNAEIRFANSSNNTVSCSPYVLEFTTHSHDRNRTKVCIRFETLKHYIHIEVPFTYFDKALMSVMSKDLPDALNERELAKYRYQKTTYGAPCISSSLLEIVNYSGASIVNYASSVEQANNMASIVKTGGLINKL